jgi:uncharacterized integral membrane protein
MNYFDKTINEIKELYKYSKNKKREEDLKEGYKNSDEPKIKSKKNDILNIVLSAIKMIIMLLLFFLFNGSIVYLIKEASEKVLDNTLPSDCKEAPYGTKDVHPCQKGMSEVQVMVAEKFLEENSLKGGQNSESEKKCNNVSYPYKWYTNDTKGWISGTFRRYLNWLIGSLAITQTNLHGHIKNFIKWVKTREINGKPLFTNSILMPISLFILSFSLIIIKFYTFFSLIYRQITTCLKHGFVDGVLPFPLIMMFFTSFFVGILDYFIGVIDSFKIFFSLTLVPLFNKEKREKIINIIRQENVVIGYVFGYAFLQILYKINMNKHYEKPVKLIPTVIFYTIVVLHFLNYLYREFYIGTKLGGSFLSSLFGSRGKCSE